MGCHSASHLGGSPQGQLPLPAQLLSQSCLACFDSVLPITALNHKQQPHHHVSLCICWRGWQMICSYSLRIQGNLGAINNAKQDIAGCQKINQAK